MLRFFRKSRITRPVINAVTIKEAKQALEEIQKLDASNNMSDLSKALLMISDTEKKYPFCRGTVFYYRGEIIESMSKNSDFNKLGPAKKNIIDLRKK
ncbi:MAG: hypothetical protein WCK49_10560 [Myxococcaceae bacterium]